MRAIKHRSFLNQLSYDLSDCIRSSLGTKREKTLYSPKPKNWSYLDWYSLHIVDVIRRENFVRLELTDKTEWIDIPKTVKKNILKAHKNLAKKT